MPQPAPAGGVRREVGINMSNTRLMLVRHGESRATIEKFFGGPRSCTGLTDTGRRQAEALRDRLMAGRDFQATALYSSKHSRAVETAQILAPALGSMPIDIDAGWENMTQVPN